MRKYPGCFITLEGDEGCGKTYQIPFLVDWLREEGLTVFPTREPGGTNISEQIRDVLHDLKNAEMHPRTETLLYQAARAQIVEEVVRPRLEKGEIVISDRFFDSTVAYQGFGHGQDLEVVKSLVRYATGGLTPDLTILVDLDPCIGAERKRKNNSEWNRMDSLPQEFYERVRKGYLKMASEEPDRWVVVDGNQARDEVFHDLKREIENRLVFESLIERGSIRGER